MIEQGSPEWFELRRGLATGSHFADVMATGRGGAEATTRRNYRMRLALEIVTGKVISDGFQGNRHTERGNELEPFARMSYESITGEIVEEVPFVKHKYLQCGVSPDGLVGNEGLVEFKAPIPAVHWDYMNLPAGTPPAEYKWQVYGEMLCTGRRWNDFVSYCEDMPEELQLHINRVHWDDKIIGELEAGIMKFIAEVNVTVREIKEKAQQAKKI